MIYSKKNYFIHGRVYEKERLEDSIQEFSFKRRHDLCQKKPQAVEIARKRNVDPFITAEYVHILKGITSEVPPKSIYNINETSFRIDPSRVKVVGEKGKAAHRVTAESGKERFSVLMGVSVAGEKLPPLIVKMYGSHG